MTGEEGAGRRLWTVGHGTLTAARFAALATDADIAVVVDVRSYPGSRRNPHQPHPVTEEARVEDDLVVYDAGVASLTQLP